MKTVNYYLLGFAMLFLFSCDNVFPEGTDCSVACDDISIQGTNLSNGDCMSLCQTCSNPSNSAAVQANCYCNLIEVILKEEGLKWKDLEDTDNVNVGDGLDIVIGFETSVKNHGQCVKAIKALINQD